MSKPGRNEPCHCGSGQKYKKCHQDADDQAAMAERAKVNAAAAAEAAARAEADPEGEAERLKATMAKAEGAAQKKMPQGPVRPAAAARRRSV